MHPVGVRAKCRDALLLEPVPQRRQGTFGATVEEQADSQGHRSTVAPSGRDSGLLPLGPGVQKVEVYEFLDRRAVEASEP
ncbi:hypothetical protein GCM10027610_042430 [Dactylosporangium cerinum]